MSDASEILSEILDAVNADNVLTNMFIMKLQEDFEYMGFNAENILRKILSYIKKDQATNSKNVLKLVAIGLFRGNNVKSIKESLKKEQSVWFGLMVAQLSIYSNMKDGPSHINNEKMTLSRLRMALPQLAFKVLKHAEFKRQIGASDIKQVIPTFYGMIPFARDMCIMSLLPKNEEGGYSNDDHKIMISQIFIYCFCETAILVKPGEQTASKAERATRVKKYMQISWNANHVKSELRKLVAQDIAKFLAEDSSRHSGLESTSESIFDYAADLGVELETAFTLSRD